MASGIAGQERKPHHRRMSANQKIRQYPGACAAACPVCLKGLARQEQNGPGIGSATKPPSERKCPTSSIRAKRTDSSA